MSGFDYDLIVIGGGPAGQAACLALKQRLGRVAVIDEQHRPGGQILRQPPAAFTVANWLTGRDYRALQEQLKAFEALDGVDWLGGRSVLGVQPEGDGWRVLVSDGGVVKGIAARRVLIATGCYDMTAPLPGWTLPGAMSAGAVQAFVKSQRLVPGRRIALAGTHPLQILIADQILEAGGQVAVVAFTQTLSSALAKVLRHPRAVLANLPRLLGVLAGAIRMAGQGTAIRFGDRPVEVLGDTEVVGLRLQTSGDVDCDSVAFCFGFLPQSDLTRAAGVKVGPGPLGGWIAHHDEWMRSSRPGLHVAGETVGVKGAEVASAEGALAGIGILLDAGRITERDARAEAVVARRRRARALAFSALLEDVGDPSPFTGLKPSAETVLCRCEDVTFAAVDQASRVAPCPGAIKLATRCGMGPCQGRNCEHLLLQQLPEQADPQPGFRARFPARPVRIGDFSTQD
jgi:thioredoxin reductase